MSRIAELEFTDNDIQERWKGAKEDFWGDLKRQTVRALQRLLETSMEFEVQDLIGVERGRHWGRRVAYRNGYYYRRNFLTSMGMMPFLTVPRVRGKRIRFKVLPRYIQRAPDVDKGVLEMFLAGVSTRRMEEVLEPLMGKGALSAGTVSRISKVLDIHVREFHRRQLRDDYLYLVLDGIYLKTKSPVHARRRCILVAYGIKADGTRELIDFKMTRLGESQAAWEGFLVSLKNRGLEGTNLKLVVVDGNQGLWNAVDLVWINVPRQRCWAHKLRNVSNNLSKKIQVLCISGARKIYCADSKTEAIQAFKKWVRLWKSIAPKAVECLERDFEDLIPFLECPKALRRKLRTTNVIEREFREVRRRTRPMSCFQNRDSVERIIFAIFYRQNQIWKEKPLNEITHKV